MFLRKFFLAVLAFLTIGTLALGHAGTVLAQGTKDEPVKLEVPIPLAQQVEGYSAGKIADLASYIGVMYQFLISIIGLLAAIMMIIGGFQYLTSAGDSGKIGAAKKRITDALIGLTLALSAYALLNTINPALLRFDPLSNSLSNVTTETAFLPFCEEMARSLGKDLSAITAAKTSERPEGCHGCGCAGFLEQPETDASGKPKLDQQNKPIASRLWCLYRGDSVKNRREDGSQFINNNCGLDDVFTSEVGGGNTEHQAMVCVPSKLYRSDDLEKMYKEQGALPSRLASCQSCAHFFSAARTNLGYLSGSQACQVWMNIANNGTPENDLFTLKNKSATHYVLDSSAPSKMYYCGYSSDRDNCVFGNIRCETGVKKCGDYDDQYITFCDRADGDGAVRCLDEPLNGGFGKGSYNKHLGPICSVNPCNVSGSCDQGLTVQTLQAVGSSGGTVGTAVTGATFGLVDPSACE